jgi:hypothetical protein
VAPEPESAWSRRASGLRRVWGSSEELRSTIERHGCEGAVRMCQQASPEEDCYGIVEEECRSMSLSRSRESSASPGEEPEGAADWEPGPQL